MKVLISAFACQPNRGSDYGVGWAWATKLAKMGHEVWVITWSNNQPQIERELKTNSVSNLHFVYCKDATWVCKAYQFVGAIRIPLGSAVVWNFSCTWWQWDAYQLAKSLHEEIVFDVVHHVTNTSVRRCSFMGFLNIPFIFGPLAGGVKAPLSLRKGYPFIGKFIDSIRDFNNSLVKFDPLMHLSFAKATKIYCDSKPTQALIPKLYQDKSEVLFSMPSYEISQSDRLVENSTVKDFFQVLFVGRFLYWKGIHLGLQAFARLHDKFPNSRFTLIGKGPQADWLQRLSEQLGIEKAVDWIPWMEQKELDSIYIQHDVLLFPSLHDSGGMVVIEALSKGLPTICLDLGGPGTIVDETCGQVVKTNKLSEERVVRSLGNALTELADNSQLLQQLSVGASARPRKFAFDRVVQHVYDKDIGRSL